MVMVTNTEQLSYLRGPFFLLTNWKIAYMQLTVEATAFYSFLFLILSICMLASLMGSVEQDTC